MYLELMTTNCGSKRLRENRRLLICGTCVKDEYPTILESFSSNRQVLLVCLEETHVNMVGLKLIDMFDIIKPEEVVVLTPDGSPHCVQLHYIVEDVKKRLRLNKLPVKHYVVDRGRVYEISELAVKVSRYLHRVERLLRSYESSSYPGNRPPSLD